MQFSTLLVIAVLAVLWRMHVQQERMMTVREELTRIGLTPNPASSLGLTPTLPYP